MVRAYYVNHVFVGLLNQYFCVWFSSRSRTMDVSVGVPVHPAKEKPPINVVGDVGGRIAIMVVSLCEVQDKWMVKTKLKHCAK